MIEKLITKSDVKLKLSTQVTAVRKLALGAFVNRNRVEVVASTKYLDRVVLALLLTEDSAIKLDLPNLFDNTGSYHQAVSTFVKGRLPRRPLDSLRIALLRRRFSR